MPRVSKSSARTLTFCGHTPICYLTLNTITTVICGMVFPPRYPLLLIMTFAEITRHVFLLKRTYNSWAYISKRNIAQQRTTGFLGVFKRHASRVYVPYIKTNNEVFPWCITDVRHPSRLNRILISQHSWRRKTSNYFNRSWCMRSV